MDNESTDTKMATEADPVITTSEVAGSATELIPLPTKQIVRAEIISLHKSASDWEMAGMTALAESNRRLGRMLARMQVEIEQGKPKIFNMPEELEALPEGTIIRLINERKNLEKLEGKWYWPGVELPYTKIWATWMPAQLIYLPEEGE